MSERTAIDLTRRYGRSRVWGATVLTMTAVGWVIIGTLGSFALLRWCAWDAIEPLAVVNALTMVVYLPAWVVAIGGAIGRRWILSAAAALVVAAQLFYVVPELSSADPLPSWSRHAWQLRLLDANVDLSVQFAGGYSTAVSAFNPDVVAMEEFTQQSLRHFRRTPAFGSFPFRCIYPHYGATGLLLISKVPMTGCQVHTVLWRAQPTPFMVSATLKTRAGPIQVRVVHTLAPFPTYWSEWKAALKAIDSTARRGSSRRVLMVGDFNATWNNRGFATLLSDGFTDAAAARGAAFEMTWPNGAVVPPFVRIDHVLTGRTLAVTHIADHRGFGSDHRYLTATVAVRRDVHALANVAIVPTIGSDR